nr:hypothetical protein [Candidatus Woesebacteria bacterium]
SLESLEKELALVPLVERSGWPSIDQRTNTARPKGTVTTIAQPFTNSTFVVSLDSDQVIDATINAGPARVGRNVYQSKISLQTRATPS